LPQQLRQQQQQLLQQLPLHLLQTSASCTRYRPLQGKVVLGNLSPRFLKPAVLSIRIAYLLLSRSRHPYPLLQRLRLPLSLPPSLPFLMRPNQPLVQVVSVSMVLYA
jgi:hypothetical protein